MQNKDNITKKITLVTKCIQAIICVISTYLIITMIITIHTGQKSYMLANAMLSIFGISSFIITAMFFKYNIRSLMHNTHIEINVIYFAAGIMLINTGLAAIGSDNILGDYLIGGYIGDIISRILGIVNISNAFITIFLGILSIIYASKESQYTQQQHQIEYTPQAVKPNSENTNYQYHSTKLKIDDLKTHKCNINYQELDHQAKNTIQELRDAIQSFKIECDVIKYKLGPVVTIYLAQPKEGVKIQSIIALEDDIARILSVSSIRIQVITNTTYIGFEVPNRQRANIHIKDIIQSNEYQTSKAKLPIILGRYINNEIAIADLAEMPHLLVGGTTGSGKSIFLHSTITSLLFKVPKEECKLMLIDPKMLDLSMLNNIENLLTPVVTDIKKAVQALKWAVKEMERRFDIMQQAQTRNIDAFNALKSHPIDEYTNQPMAKMPRIVIIIDELADLMIVSGKDVEASIQRLAQMGRAAGMHVICATQRPSVDVITGTIKANFPTRIAFRVVSKIDSQTILHYTGAEKLLGKGDMLYTQQGTEVQRIHAPFISDQDITTIANKLKCNGQEYVDLNEKITHQDEESSEYDEQYYNALEVLKGTEKVSISYMQRKLRIGYNKSANIIEQLEQNGYISPQRKDGTRHVLKKA